MNYQENVNYYTTTTNNSSVHHFKAWRKDNYSNRKFQCAYCDYNTYLKADLRKHERVHTGERPYQCQICPYRSSQKSTLKRHQLTHLKDH